MITPIEIIRRNITPITGVDVVSKVPAVRPTLFLRIDMGAPQRINLDQVETLIIIQGYGHDPEEVLDLLGDALANYWNLHHALKAHTMKLGIPLQVVWESTLAGESLRHH